MKSSTQLVQTVSIMDTISQLAANSSLTGAQNKLTGKTGQLDDDSRKLGSADIYRRSLVGSVGGRYASRGRHGDAIATGGGSRPAPGPQTPPRNQPNQTNQRTVIGQSAPVQDGIYGRVPNSSHSERTQQSDKISTNAQSLTLPPYHTGVGSPEFDEFRRGLLTTRSAHALNSTLTIPAASNGTSAAAVTSASSSSVANSSGTAAVVVSTSGDGPQKSRSGRAADAMIAAGPVDPAAGSRMRPKQRRRMVVTAGGGVSGGCHRRPNQQPQQHRSGAVSLQQQGLETPDWIRELFTLARRGNIEKMSESVVGMEKSMIRNISDHLGNNLLHTAAQFGHATMVAWLSNRLGTETEAALSDENKQGFTPITLAIKYGRLEVVKWLVRNTRREKDRMQTRDGERSHLHNAAKYGQDNIAGWLCEEMREDGIELDQMDISGNTPLHLAARSGRTKTVSTLLNLGASVNMKNDMGLKPADTAQLRGKASTAEFLMMYETSLNLTRDLLSRDKSLEAAQGETTDLKQHFREVLTVSKKLAKEREEMCREVARLQENMRELHNNIINDMRDFVSSADTVKNERVDQRIEDCLNLQEKWEDHSTKYFSSSLADLEHRILLAEDGSKKNRTPGSSLSMEPSYCQRLLRDRLEEVKGQSSSLALLGSASTYLSASPSTAAEDDTASSHGLTDADDPDGLANNGQEVRSPTAFSSGSSSVLNRSNDQDFYESMRSPQPPVSSASGPNSLASRMLRQRQKLATPLPSPIKNSGQKRATNYSTADNSQLSGYNESLYGGGDNNSTLYTSIHGSYSQLDSSSVMGQHAFNSFHGAFNTSLSPVGGIDYQRAKAAAMEMAKMSSLPINSSTMSSSIPEAPAKEEPLQMSSSSTTSLAGFSREERRLQKDRLRQQLQQLALVSDSGSASVIEVIEPDSSEDEQQQASSAGSNLKSVEAGGGGPAVEDVPRRDFYRRSSSSNNSGDGGGLAGGSGRSAAGGGASGEFITSSPVKKWSGSSTNSGNNSSHRLENGRPASYHSASGYTGKDDLTVRSGGDGALADFLASVRGGDSVGASTGEEEEEMMTGRGDSKLSESMDDLDDNSQEPVSLQTRPQSALAGAGATSSNNLSVNPAAGSAKRRSGFLKKLSIAKWASTTANSSGGNGSSGGGKNRPGRGKSPLSKLGGRQSRDCSADNKPPRPKERDDSVSPDTPNKRNASKSSVTRIELVGDGQRDQDSPLTGGRPRSSASPGSKKSSAYSNYIRSDANGVLSVAKSDDSGIAAVAESKDDLSHSRPESSSGSSEGGNSVRKSYSGSSNNSDPTGSLATSDRIINRESGNQSTSNLDECSITSISETGNQTTTIVISSNKLGQTENNNNNNNNHAVDNIYINNNNNSKFQYYRNGASLSGHGHINGPTSDARASRPLPSLPTAISTAPTSEKPWYDVSDEDVDIPAPDHITSIISVRGSSDEDVF